LSVAIAGIYQERITAKIPFRSAHVLTPNPAYRPELDALRFFAFLCVFNLHRLDYALTDPVRDLWSYRIGVIGAFGVPVFFMLSAFLITDLLLRERDRTGNVHVGSFYMRRILRIWPLYFASFFGLAMLNHFVPGVGTNNRLAYLEFTLFAGNWYIVRHGWIAAPVAGLWSISVEEQFYIVIPLLASLGGRRALRWVCYLLLVASYITIWRYALYSPEQNRQWTNSFFDFQYFCVGTLLAILLRGRAPKLLIPVRLFGFALAFACWLVALIRFHVKSYAPHATVGEACVGWLLVLIGTLLFFVCTLGMPSKFVPQWLIYLGRISYGLYIFHPLVYFMVFNKIGPLWSHRFHSLQVPDRFSDLRIAAGIVFAFALNIALAHLSYRYFERPFLRLKQRFSFVTSRRDTDDRLDLLNLKIRVRSPFFSSFLS
jgi:peptidoglycan/LPS O-acetylase OafA/YrhL